MRGNDPAAAVAAAVAVAAAAATAAYFTGRVVTNVTPLNSDGDPYPEMGNMDGEYGWTIWMENMDGEYEWRICMGSMDGEYGWGIWMGNMDGEYAYGWGRWMGDIDGEYGWGIGWFGHHEGWPGTPGSGPSVSISYRAWRAPPSVLRRCSSKISSVSAAAA